MTLTTFVDVFFSFDDAVRWIDGHLEDFPTSEYELIELRLNYLGGGFRAGCSFKKLPEPQLELDV